MPAISASHPPSATTTNFTPPSSDHEGRSWDYDNYQRTEVGPTQSYSGPSGALELLSFPARSDLLFAPPMIGC